MSATRLAGVLAFLLAVFVLVPAFIAMTGRWDFYYTLTSVALLSVASAGVWLTFYIGRINIGQGAYALVGGYVSAILVTQAFHLPRALLTCDGLGVNAVGVVADQQPYRDARWYEMRETVATMVAAWDVFRRQPPALIETTGQRSDWAMQLAGED